MYLLLLAVRRVRYTTIRGHLKTVKLPSAGCTHVGLSRTLGDT